MMELSARFTSGATDDDAEALWRFLTMAGVKRPRDESDAREIERLTRHSRHLRAPVEPSRT